MFCPTCGKELNDSAVICPGCGCPTSNHNKMISGNAAGSCLKNPWVAGILSAVLMGSGQIYNGQIAKGFVMMIGGITISVITGGVAGLPLGIYAIIDAVKIANRINNGEHIGDWDSWGKNR